MPIRMRFWLQLPSFMLSLVLGIALARPAAALTVTSTTTDGSDLVAAIVGSGITVTPGSVSYIGAPDQAGTFVGGFSSDFGIDSGIIMTTGSAYDAEGLNGGLKMQTTADTGGDADLTALIYDGSPQPPFTLDRNVLEFDFTTAGGDLYFNFLFASEEYNLYVGASYNDVFAFWVDGVNIALAPDLSPVSISNVNCGNPYSGSGPNCDSFNNNDGTLAYDNPYDGFTDVFVAELLGLSPGEHHIKMAIADAGDTIIESAVLIQAGTFSDQSTNVPEPSTGLLVGLGLALIARTGRTSS